MKFVTMTTTSRGSNDGIEVLDFHEGETYEVSDDLAKSFCEDARPTLAKPATEDEIAACMAGGAEPEENAATGPDENAADAPDETKKVAGGRKTRGAKRADAKKRE